jgi:hypothetical protein
MRRVPSFPNPQKRTAGIEGLIFDKLERLGTKDQDEDLGYQDRRDDLCVQPSKPFT